MLFNRPNFPVRENSIESELLNLGFSLETVERAMAHFEFRSLEQAMNSMIKTPHGWRHPYIPKEIDDNRCEIWDDVYEEHFRESRQSEDLSYLPEDECGICYSQEYLIRILPWTHKFWKQWLIDYVMNMIMTGRVLHIKWPSHNWSEKFQDYHVRKLLDSQSYSKYETFKKNYLSDLDPNSRWCPTPNCDTIIKGKADSKKLTCPSWHVDICFECNELWHGKRSWQQATDGTFDKWAKGKRVQTWPNCRRRVEKEDGCNHMTCISCDHQWCWLCRGRYTPNHYSPLNPFGCPGMQDGENERTYRRVFCIWFMRVMVILFFPVVFVLFVIIGTPLMTSYLFYQAMLETENEITEWRAWFLVGVVFMLSTIFMPIIWTVIIILGIIRLFEIWIYRLRGRISSGNTDPLLSDEDLLFGETSSSDEEEFIEDEDENMVY